LLFLLRLPLFALLLLRWLVSLGGSRPTPCRRGPRGLSLHHSSPGPVGRVGSGLYPAGCKQWGRGGPKGTPSLRPGRKTWAIQRPSAPRGAAAGVATCTPEGGWSWRKAWVARATCAAGPQGPAESGGRGPRRPPSACRRARRAGRPGVLQGPRSYLFARWRQVAAAGPLSVLRARDG